MSVQAMSWVIDNSKHKGNTFVVLLMIANHAKSDGSGAWPSIHTLAKESRLSDRTVQRCIHRLSRPWKKIAKPELLVRSGKGPYGANLYDIPGCQTVTPGDKTGSHSVSDTVTPPVSQLSHPIRHLTVSKDKEGCLPTVPPEENFKRLNQLLDDWYAKRWQTDEAGKKYLLAPASPHRRVYEGELQ